MVNSLDDTIIQTLRLDEVGHGLGDKDGQHDGNNVVHGPCKFEDDDG